MSTKLQLNGAPRVNRRGVVIIPACGENGGAYALRITRLNGSPTVDGRSVVVPCVNGRKEFDLHVKASAAGRLARQLSRLNTSVPWVRELADSLLTVSAA